MAGVWPDNDACPQGGEFLPKSSVIFAPQPWLNGQNAVTLCGWGVKAGMACSISG